MGLKRVFSAILLLVIMLALVVPVIASGSETVSIPSDPPTDADLSPMSGDMINIIIILVCISGTAPIILLLLTFTRKK